MENTTRLTDQEMIEIAWEAVKAHFAPSVIETSDIEVRQSVKALAEITDPDDDKTASIWFVHQDNRDVFDPTLITKANIQIWNAMKERGDTRFVPLYHGFRSDPRATRRAA
jgi:hypothetical protein